MTSSETPAPETPAPEPPAPTVTVTQTVDPSPSPDPTVKPVPRVPPLAFPSTLHGEFVLPGDDGCGFTVFAQTGQAVALAEDAITVRSQDGFEKAYAMTEATRTLAGRRGNEVRQGDWVSVTATTVGETATAAYVFDLTRPKRNFWRGDGWWSYKPWRPSKKWRNPTPCPTPSVPAPTPTPTVTDTVPPEETPTPSLPPTDLPTPEPTPTVTDTVPPEETPTPTPTPTPSP
ncbi:hypothetical protein ACLQ2R_19350 [Streptosporangium sp. DT93]|uniref:hypothetical protein n=1 Tax=Streptosporangium sp. DT93 TaxID=3393428 RepID=UPI003CE9F230